MNIALPLPGRRPSPRRMEMLLESNPAKFEKYLARYPDLADIFEINNPFAELADTARRALDAAAAVPNDLAARLRTRIDAAQTDTSPLAVMLDLTTISFGVVDTITDDRPLT